jgi:hypothetical protein
MGKLLSFAGLSAALLSATLTLSAVAQPADSQTTPPAVAHSAFAGGPGPCEELPKGELSDAQLRELVPDNAPGRVFIRWRTESQEDNYGFNIYRADKPNGPYKKINEAIIPGEGSTNIPKDYCYVDKPLARGATFYYYIESVSNSGVAETIAETKGTKVKVKTVAEEREWLRKKALGAVAATAATYLIGQDDHHRPTVKAFAEKAAAEKEMKSAGGNLADWMALEEKEVANRCGFCDRAVYPEDAARVKLEELRRRFHLEHERDVRDAIALVREVHGQRCLAGSRHPDEHDLRLVELLGVAAVVVLDRELEGLDALEVVAVGLAYHTRLPGGGYAGGLSESAMPTSSTVWC